MSRVLVTGANGFIGNKVAFCFGERGYEVIGWDRQEKQNPVQIKNLDMSCTLKIEDGLLDANPDIIIHCAGNADVGKSVQNPEMDFYGNVVITRNLLFALHKLEMDNTRLVFLSSAGVYGNPKELPITEETELNPLSPYAVHKVMCEDLCTYFVKNYGMDIKVARIFSAYGNGLKKQIFWDMYTKASKTGKLDMFGTGNESRDYIHINDVISAIYILATTTSDQVVFNVANGEEITIREATKIFAEHAGVKEENITFNGIVREGDPLNWKADITKIKKLGYQKSVSMKDGLLEYYKWARGQ